MLQALTDTPGPEPSLWLFAGLTPACSCLTLQSLALNTDLQMSLIRTEEKDHLSQPAGDALPGHWWPSWPWAEHESSDTLCKVNVIQLPPSVLGLCLHCPTIPISQVQPSVEIKTACPEQFACLLKLKKYCNEWKSNAKQSMLGDTVFCRIQPCWRQMLEHADPP